MDNTTTGERTPDAAVVKHSGPTPGPWEYVPSTENHGPYVSGPYGGDICDCYTMSNLSDRAVCNGGTSKPIPFQREAADANARLIAAAPELLAQLQSIMDTMPRSQDRGPMMSMGRWRAARAAIAKATGAA